MDKKIFNSYINEQNFKTLFNEIGWDNSNQSFSVLIDEEEYNLVSIAEKRGFMVWTCEVAEIPLNQLYRRIDQKLRKTSNDYILIFTQHTPENDLHHLWIVPVKSIEKRNLIAIEYTLIEQTEFLFSKLNDLTFGVTEEVTIVDVTQRINRAFEINSEKITKDFYAGFKKQHDNFAQFIKGIQFEGDKQWYVSVMLNRLMFCYFIQKKRFLNFDENYLRNKLEWSKTQKGKDKFFKSFYKGFLCALFHGGLNSPQHDAEFQKVYGRIPYMNGGMFDEHQLEKQYKDLDIDDQAFDDLFTFFDKYKWHLDTRIEASGKDINPDVLGYIFEQYINDRAQMGAYYTKEDITEYIGKNCILPFLMGSVQKTTETVFKSDGYVWTQLKNSGDSYVYDAVKHGYSEDWQAKIPTNIAQGLDTQKPNLLERRKDWNTKTSEQFALPTEIWRETIERLNRCDDILQKIKNGEITTINDFITYNLNIRQFVQDLLQNTDDHLFIKHFYDSLQKISILDPTCGSGAFLFAALNILEPLYETCIARMEEFNSHNNKLFADVLAEIKDKYRSNIQYFIYKSIILRNLYGVDIMVEATEIAKLRLFLKMVAVVEVDRRAENLGLDPLPDIDFNIRCGNTLVGYATEKELDDSFTTGDMFEKVEWETKIKEKMDIVAMAFETFKTLQLTQHNDIITFKNAKTDLNTRLKELNDTLNRRMFGTMSNNTKDQKQREDLYNEFLKTHQPFHWLAEFYQIIHGNGGFDVIIGNPPYVVYTKKNSETKKSVSDVYKLDKYTTSDTNNLYAYTIERALKLIHTLSHIGMIIPISSVSNEKFSSLQTLMLNNMLLWFSCFSNRPGKLFDNVEQRLTVFLGFNKPNKNEYFSSSYNHWYIEERSSIFKLLSYHINYKEEFDRGLFKVGTKLEYAIYKKLRLIKGSLANLFSNLSIHGCYYHNAPTYFIRAMSFKPNSREDMQESSHYKKIKCDLEKISKVVCILNSSLFYWFYKNVSNCRDFSEEDISIFPFNDCDIVVFNEILNNLIKSYSDNKTIKSRSYNSGLVYYEEYYPAKSKPIIDEIDKVLAKHYGFTDEELDFIINYDIKYRMGDELESAE